MPLAVLLMEPLGWRRLAVGGLTAGGAAACDYIIYALMADHSSATIEHHSVHYDNPLTATAWIAGIYVLVTCGSLALSKVVRWFGLLNFVGVAATLVFARYAFTSVWCLYAAIISVVLYWQFSNRKINVRQPNTDLAEGSEPRYQCV